MKVSVMYEDTDVAKLLELIITHPNKDEFVKLLTPLICSNSQAVNHLFKLNIGNELPQILPIGSLCYVPVDQTGWGVDTTKTMESKLANSKGYLVGTIEEFRGYHEYSPYKITFKAINDKGAEVTSYNYFSEKDIELIEEF